VLSIPPLPRPSDVRRAQALTAPPESTSWIVDALAIARLTRLVTSDVITEPARERLVCWTYRRHGDEGEAPATGWVDFSGADPDAPKLAKLVTCPWCVSVYLGAAVVVLRRWLPGWHLIARGLAASEVAGLLAGHEHG